MRILVVEDQLGEGMLRMLRRCFPEATVSLALNGVEGWNRYLKSPPDLVITDWNMPKMNGGELAKKIRGFKKSQKIMLWTANGPETYQDYAQHFNAILDKGIFAAELEAIIMGVMDEGVESSK